MQCCIVRRILCTIAFTYIMPLSTYSLRCNFRSSHQNYCKLTKFSKVMFSYRGMSEAGAPVDNLPKLSAYWKGEISKLTSAKAIKLIDLLDKGNELGYDLKEKKDGKTKDGTLVQWTIEQKKIHNDKVLLVRCGDFYESYGIDAVMLVEHCGLNPMGKKPRAGCPKDNLQATLDDLTNAGLMVAVFEERSREHLSGTKKKSLLTKDRYLSQIVSQSQRNYLHGDLALSKEDIAYKVNSPVYAVMGTSQGFLVCQYYLDEQTIKVFDRMTKEGLLSLIALTGLLQPVYLQPQQSKTWQFDAIFTNYTRVTMKGYPENDFVKAVLQGHIMPANIVPNNAKEQPVESYRVVSLGSSGGDRPRPVYLNTAMQIGLRPNVNVPNLLNFLLPKEQSRTTAANFLRDWIMCPPPAHIADHMRNLCGLLANADFAISLPSFTPTPIGKIVGLLRSGQGNSALFRNVHSNAAGVLGMLVGAAAAQGDASIATEQSSNTKEGKNNASNRLVLQLAALTGHCLGNKVDIEALRDSCRRIVSLIEKSILPEDTDDLYTEDPRKVVPDLFFVRNEEVFRGKVNIDANADVSASYHCVKKTSDVLLDVIQREYSSDRLVYDTINNLLLLSDSKPKKKLTTANGESSSVHSEAQSFIEVKDRNNKVIEKKQTTANVMAAQRDYCKATEQATAAVRAVLKDTCDDLLSEMDGIYAVAKWAEIVTAASEHTISSLQRGWTLPSMVNNDDDDDNNDQMCSRENDFVSVINKEAHHQSTASSSLLSSDFGHRELFLEGLSPYWLDRRSKETKLNGVRLQGIFLLTAPNMSGKSTTMRSILVSALLANCGLFVPATRSQVPRYDNYFLRTASYDIPSEGMSAFALEMNDVDVFLRDCTDRSLVMLDEIGKGTSTKDGAALAGAILEKMDRLGVSGIFATHLHELFELDLKLRHTREKRMKFEFDPETGSPVWEYCLEDGRCTDSLAVHTARAFGIPEDVLKRAEELGRAFSVRFYPSARDNNNYDIDKMDLSAHEEGVGDFEHAGQACSPYQPTSSLMRTAAAITASCVTELQTRCSYSLESLLPHIKRLSGSMKDPIIVEHSQVPPPAFEGQSVVYVLHLVDTGEIPMGPMGGRDEEVYVGETESIRQRLQQHKDKSRRDGRKSVKIRAAVFAVKSKSQARAVETTLINGFKDQGIFIQRDSDGNHELFGA